MENAKITELCNRIMNVNILNNFRDSCRAGEKNLKKKFQPKNENGMVVHF